MSLLKDGDFNLLMQLNQVQLREELSRNGVVVCPIHGCDQDFKSLWGLKYHLKQTDHRAASGSERKFKCEQCNLLFQSRVKLQQHRMVEHSGGDGETPR